MNSVAQRTEIQLSDRDTSELILEGLVTELGRAFCTEEQPEEGTEHPRLFSELQPKQEWIL